MAKDKTYTVFARRYRPAAFDEVVGQEHVARTLRNAIADERVGHAYLFTGPRGVGKTTMARLFARALTCLRGPSDNPCRTCEICLAVHEGTDTDVIEMDAASNRHVEDARDLRGGLRYAPLRARFKIYIIDEAHMLTREAFNTLLKSLEEPPPHVKFIFCTTEAHKLPETITSRCQRFDFRRITGVDITRRLGQIAGQEKIEVSDPVLAAIARAARGSMRDAESLLDQIVSFKTDGLSADDVSAVLGEARGTHLSELVGAIRSGDAARVFTSLAAIFAAGVDTAAFTDQLLERFRALLAAKVCGPDPDIIDLPETDLAECAGEASGLAVEALLYFIQLVLEAKRRIREGANPRFVLEAALVKMARSADLVPLSEALRVKAQAAPEPAPAPEAAEPAAPPPEPVFTGVPSGTKEAQAAWPRVAEAVREKSLFAGTLLKEGRVASFDGNELTFRLPGHFKRYHIEQLEAPKNREAIEAAAASVFGKKIRVRITLESGSGPARKTPSRSAALPSDAAGDPAVKKILDAFGGSKVVGVE